MAKLNSSYSTAIGVLLNNGTDQVLPISKASLIELVGTTKPALANSNNVDEALAYLAGNIYIQANLAETNAKTYTSTEIGKLNFAGAGNTDGSMYISYVSESNGVITAEAKTLNATAVAYANSVTYTNVQDELTHLEAALSALDSSSGLHLYVGETGENAPADGIVHADGQTYRLVQGGQDIAKFNIEKDSFVKQGQARQATQTDVNNATPEAGEAPFAVGDWIIALTIKTSDDATEDTIYIPAESLIDAYDANNTDHNVAITVDNTNNTIGATIVTGGVNTAELADDAVTTAKILDSNVTTAKIADGNVTYAKLNSDVTSYLAKADSAVQDVYVNGRSTITDNISYTTIATGTGNGTISVNNHDVAVKGLLDIAYTGAASDVTVTTTANDALSTLAAGVNNADVDDVQGALQTIATAVNNLAGDAVTSITGATYTHNNATITIGPDTASDGDVTLTLTHNLGNVSLLNYETVNNSVEAIDSL